MATQFLTNSFLGPAYSLQINKHSKHKKGLHAAPSRDGGLIWAIVPSPEDPGKYNICTTYKDKPRCLDIFNDGSPDLTRVCLADPGHYSGQTWTLIPQPEQGYYKLSNDWTGPGWFLDTYDGNYEACMSQGDTSGQQWLLASIAPTSSAPWPPPPAFSDGGESGQHHHTASKVAGGAAAAYLAGKMWDKLN